MLLPPDESCAAWQTAWRDWHEAWVMGLPSPNAHLVEPMAHSTVREVSGAATA